MRPGRAIMCEREMWDRGAGETRRTRGDVQGEKERSMDNIIFIGMPAAGKSTSGSCGGEAAGLRLSWTWTFSYRRGRRSSCTRSSRSAGRKGSWRWRTGSTPRWRRTRCIISPGGSVVYCRNAMEHYKRIGKVVYLQVSYETIKDRIGDPLQERGCPAGGPDAPGAVRGAEGPV